MPEPEQPAGGWPTDWRQEFPHIAAFVTGCAPMAYALGELIAFTVILWLLSFGIDGAFSIATLTLCLVVVALARTHALHHAAPSGDDA